MHGRIQILRRRAVGDPLRPRHAAVPAGDEPSHSLPLADFAAYYGFRPVVCLPRRARTKGQVERVWC